MTCRLERMACAHRMLGSCVAWLAVTLAPTPGHAAPPDEPAAKRSRAASDPAWRVDEQGRVFRVAFPLHDRLVVDYAIIRTSGHEIAQRAHVGWKTTLGLDFAEESVWWRLRHTVADVEYRWGAAGQRRLAPTALRGDYLRHDLNSSIVIPADRDLHIPAPFDIGVDYELGGVDLRQDRGDWSVRKVDVARVAIPLDFIRDPDYRHRLAIGPAAAYRIRPNSEGWRHQIAPLSGAAVVYAWESADGIDQVDVRGSCLASLSFGEQSSDGWSTRCGGRARAEVVVFSINDRPFSIPLEVGVTEAFGDNDPLGWHASIGVRLSLINQQ